MSETTFSSLKRGVLGVGTFCAVLSLWGAPPRIDREDIRLEADGNRAVITYTLSDAPAIVTVDIQTNTAANAAGEWVSVGGENIQTFSSDSAVNRIVRGDGEKRIVWRARKDLPDRTFPNGIRAEVKAWALNNPPTWLVAGLDRDNDVRFYADKSFLPQGFSSQLYKQTHLLMRRIPAAGVVWRMGLSKQEGQFNATYDHSHNVMLTKDYYIGVYPITQGQYTNVTKAANTALMRLGNFDLAKTTSAYVSNLTTTANWPMNAISLAQLRGQTDAFTNTADSNIYYSKDGHKVGKDCWIDKLRKQTGLDDFDLPTEAQWEFACRAGTDTAYYNGSMTDAHYSEIGWWSQNSDGYTTVPDRSKATPLHEVGCLLGNAFDLYDMCGNVKEVCVERMLVGDDYVNSLATGWEKGVETVDPDGGTATVGDSRLVVKKGGDVAESRECAKSGARDVGGWSYTDYWTGARLWHPAEFK